jgi:hypothetical protein
MCSSREKQDAYVAAELELVLLVCGGGDFDTGPHVDSSHNLLANEVSDLNLVVALGVLVDVHVDGETGGSLALRATPQK